MRHALLLMFQLEGENQIEVFQRIELLQARWRLGVVCISDLKDARVRINRTKPPHEGAFAFVGGGPPEVICCRPYRDRRDSLGRSPPTRTCRHRSWFFHTNDPTGSDTPCCCY